MKQIDKYNKWALVTGASEGIGKDFANELAKSGFSVYLVARNKEKLEQIRKDLSAKYPVSIEINSKDLSNPEEVATLIQDTKEINFGLVVLAAGFGTGGRFKDLPIENELNMLDLNCRSVVQLSHHYINRSLGKSKLGLILFGSLVGFQGVPWASTYAATKAFVQTFAEGLSGEYNESGIDVLSVAPGPVSSGFGSRAGMQMSMSQSPIGIAEKALAALGKQTTVRPGFLSKFLGWSLAFLPRSMRSFLLKQIMSDMVFGKK